MKNSTMHCKKRIEISFLWNFRVRCNEIEIKFSRIFKKKKVKMFSKVCRHMLTLLDVWWNFYILIFESDALILTSEMKWVHCRLYLLKISNAKMILSLSPWIYSCLTQKFPFLRILNHQRQRGTTKSLTIFSW